MAGIYRKFQEEIFEWKFKFGNLEIHSGCSSTSAIVNLLRWDEAT